MYPRISEVLHKYFGEPCCNLQSLIVLHLAPPTFTRLPIPAEGETFPQHYAVTTMFHCVLE